MKNTLRLFIFVDALGWRIVREHGFLSSLLPNRNACQTVFGYSSSCDPTILTGLSPAEHGHFSCFVKAQGASPFAGLARLRWLPSFLTSHHRVRHRLSARIARHSGMTGYFQLYNVPFRYLPHLDYTEKKDLYEPGGILNGQETIFDHWRRSGRSWLKSDWRNGDDHNLAEFEKAVSGRRIELGYLFTAGLDAVMHRDGTQGDSVKRWLTNFAHRIERLYHVAESLYDDVKFFVFSDHGMTDTQQVSTMMLDWEAQGHRFGRDYTAVWDSTMVRFWFGGNMDLLARTRDWLAGRPEGRVLTDLELERWGCLFPGRPYGELFYLLEPGTLFAPSFMNQSRVTGMHGYDPGHVDSSGCWLTNDPETSASRLQDIFPVMKRASTEGRSSTRAALPA